jgi:hypothetical protein
MTNKNFIAKKNIMNKANDEMVGDVDVPLRQQ